MYKAKKQNTRLYLDDVSDEEKLIESKKKKIILADVNDKKEDILHNRMNSMTPMFIKNIIKCYEDDSKLDKSSNMVEKIWNKNPYNASKRLDSVEETLRDNIYTPES